MSELQDTINRIMSNPEAMRQVQSLGEQLGLSGSNPEPAAPPSQPPTSSAQNTGGDMMSAMTKLAPMLSAARPNDETAALLNALKPFLSGEKLKRLQSAQRLISLIKIIPLIKDSGMFL